MRTAFREQNCGLLRGRHYVSINMIHILYFTKKISSTISTMNMTLCCHLRKGVMCQNQTVSLHVECTLYVVLIVANFPKNGNIFA